MAVRGLAAAGIDGFKKGELVEPYEPGPLLIAAVAGTSPEQSCEVFFYGDYHYCGDAGGGYVLCCLGGELH